MRAQVQMAAMNPSQENVISALWTSPTRSSA